MRQASYNTEMETIAPIVQENAFLTLHYRLSGLAPQRDIVNTFNGQAATLSLGRGELASALEACLLGMHEGEQGVFELPAGAAFGEHHADKLQWVSGSLLDELNPGQETYTPGDAVQFPSPNGGQSFAGVVMQVEQSRVLFDFNHPLAGKPVRFEVHIIGVL